jgi:hypothetical protein
MGPPGVSSDLGTGSIRMRPSWQPSWIALALNFTPFAASDAATVHTVCPTGKSPKTCPALLRKIFRLTCRANQWFLFARLTRQEGRLAIVTNARWDAVDADVPLTNGAEADGEVVWSWRPTLAPSS